MWQWLCAPHAQVSRNILMYGGQVKQTDKTARTIATGVLRLLNHEGSVNSLWAGDPDVLDVLKLKDYEAKRLLKSIFNIRYSRRYLMHTWLQADTTASKGKVLSTISHRCKALPISPAHHHQSLAILLLFKH